MSDGEKDIHLCITRLSEYAHPKSEAQYYATSAYRLATELKARAEAAEAERDEARATKDLHKARQEQEIARADDAEARSESLYVEKVALEKAVKERDAEIERLTRENFNLLADLKGRTDDWVNRMRQAEESRRLLELALPLMAGDEAAFRRGDDEDDDTAAKRWEAAWTSTVEAIRAHLAGGER